MIVYICNDICIYIINIFFKKSLKLNLNIMLSSYAFKVIYIYIMYTET